VSSPQWPPGPSRPDPSQPDRVPPPQSGWGQPPAWYSAPRPASHTLRNGCLIALVAVAALIGLGVASCVVVLMPAMDTAMKIRDDSHGLVRSASYQWNNGTGEFYLWLETGVPDSAGRDVACHIVRPALKGSQFEYTKFEVIDSRGLVIADERTPCG
jgi:hypothetical protein